MRILTNRMPAVNINGEWAGQPGIGKVQSDFRKSYSSRTGKPHDIPQPAEVKLYYSEGSEFIIQAIKKLLGVEVFKKFMIGIAEAECSFSSDGYNHSGYMGLDTADLDNPNSSQNYNVHPEIMKHAKLVSTAQRGSRYAIGFPGVVKNDYRGERYDINALSSFIITNMARLSEGKTIDNEGQLITLLLWAVNHWRGTNSNIKLYLAKMEKYTTYNVAGVSRSYIAAYKASPRYAQLVKKMQRNFY